MLEYHADPAAQWLQPAFAETGKVVALELELSHIRAFKPVQATDQGGLAGTAAPDLQRNAVKRHHLAEAPGHAIHVQN